MEKVFLGIGSNVGDRIGFIRESILLLSKHLKEIKQGKIYLSRAVGYEDQPEFLNTAVCGYTDISPEDLLKTVKDIEKKIGRVKRFRWGPRETDIDILFYGNKIIEKEDLVIPHPRLHERDFVLMPLNDIEPDFVHPVFKKTVKELLYNLKEKSVIKVIHSTSD